MSRELPPDEDSAAALDDPGLDLDLLQRRRDRLLTVVAVAVILVLSVTTAYLLFRPKPVDERALISAAHQSVREALGLGLVYQFSVRSETLIEPVEEESYRVSGEVAAVNPGGRSTGYAFDCTLKQRPDGTWAPVKLKLTPR
jgi:hypothetical protein